MENIKEVSLKLKSIECFMLACMLYGETIAAECPEEEKPRIETNIELLLQKMELPEFRQYFITINLFDDSKLDEVQGLLDQMNEIVVDPSQEDRAKFIADLMVITRDKK